jgi:hypothetical protein
MNRIEHALWHIPEADGWARGTAQYWPGAHISLSCYGNRLAKQRTSILKKFLMDGDTESLFLNSPEWRAELQSRRLHSNATVEQVLRVHRPHRTTKVRMKKRARKEWRSWTLAVSEFVPALQGRVQRALEFSKFERPKTKVA